MALIRYYDPFAELEEMQQRLSNLFSSQAGAPSQASLTTPIADVYVDDTQNNLVVEAHLPGYTQEDINIDVEGGALTIRAEHREKAEDKGKRKYIVRESSSSFYRRIGLPKNVSANKIKAHFDDGLLKVTLPFKELPKPKSINIESAKVKKAKK